MQSDHAQLEQSKVRPKALLTRKGDGYRIERTVWVVMLALPLLAYCVVAVLSFSIKPKPINTGDALYDKYVAWVADDLLVNHPSDYFYGTYSTSSDPRAGYDPFADWEAEFGNDPRYWMLRYRYAKLEITKSGPYSTIVIDHLEKARKLGVADGAILLTLLQVLDAKTRSHTNYVTTPGLAKHEQMVESEKQARDFVDEQMGAEHNKLLAELMEVAGNNSMPHYYSAIFDSQRGDYEAALVHLAAGNRAPDNSSLVGFPFEKHSLDMQQGNPLSDKLASGSIIMERMNVPLPNNIHIKNMVKKLVIDAVSRDDRAALDEIHTYSCRQGRAKGGDIIAATVSYNLAGTVETGFNGQYYFALSSEQISNLSNLSSLRGQVITQVRANYANSTMFNPFTLPLQQKALWFIESSMSGGRSFAVWSLGQSHDDCIKEQAVLSSVGQLFEQMESFNYNTLEWE